MSASFVLTAFAGLFFAAPAPKDDPVKTAVERLQGTWIVTSINRKSELSKGWDLKFVFSGEQMTIIQREKKRDGTIAFKIDPSKDPIEIDFTSSDAVKGDPARPGIYVLDGDTLKISMADFHTETLTEDKTGKFISRKVVVGKRPPSFEDKNGVTYFLKREKK